MTATRPRILFAVNSLAFLRSHRAPLVRAAVAEGWSVHIVGGAPQDERDRAAQAEFAALGATVHTIPLSRSSMNPWDLWRTTGRLRRVYHRVTPDLVHQVTPKVAICGSVAARLAGVPAVVTAISGLGFLFSGAGAKGRLLAFTGRALYSGALRHRRQVIIVQNERDRAMLTALLPAGTRFVHFFGSGVDLARFAPSPLPPGDPVVVLPARMLRDKGVPDFVEAGRLLRARGVRVRLALCGAPDPGNPASLTEGELEALDRSGAVEYWGFQADMAACLRRASAACLPSVYGEGLPLALAEAAAAGRAIITTDTPGCRDTVRDGVSGALVPPADPAALAEAIAAVVADRPALERMGAASRALAEERFSIGDVTAGHLAVYHSLLEGGAPPSSQNSVEPR